MSTFKACHHHTKPAEDEVRGEQTIRVHLQRCPPEAPPSFLPVSNPEEQSCYHRAYGVLQIGDQMDREEGKRASLTSTQKARNGDLLLPKGREQINAVAPVGGNGPIAVGLATQGTGSSDNGGEINPPRQKRFSVFPDTLKCVKEDKLYCSAALFSRGQVFGSYTYWPASLVRVVILPRSIPYLTNLTTLISPVTIPCKSSPLYPRYKGVNNSHGPPGFTTASSGAAVKFLHARLREQRAEARGLICYWAVSELGYRLTDLARKLGMTQSGVGYAVEHGEKIALEDNY